MMMPPNNRRCTKCNGSGRYRDHECPACKGTGYIDRGATINCHPEQSEGSPHLFFNSPVIGKAHVNKLTGDPSLRSG
jgi:hypothetical protein